MCFGSKSTADESAGARPVSLDASVRTKPLATWATSRPRPQPQPQPQPLLQDDHAALPAAMADGDYAPPPGAPPSYGDVYAPPSGPPPSHVGNDYAPPTGPPPSHGNDYAPPSGPPPSHAGNDAPPGPPQHDWQSAVPDTSLLPPPPALFEGWDRSPATNAPEEQADAGEAWCNKNALAFPPMDLRHNDATRRVIASWGTLLQRPAAFKGTLQQKQNGDGAGATWTVSSAKGAPDACLVGFPPSYAPSLHSPTTTNRPFVAYYEVYVQRCRDLVTLAMGFAAMPYPPFRMPGWHRGSLAVHGDDGHRFVNDTCGGKTLRDGFRMMPGGTYGIGMRFAQNKNSAGVLDVGVFVTVEGELFAEWDVHEETDAEDVRPVTGLEGYHDLSIAVGVYDEVQYEVRPHPTQWKYEALKREKLAGLVQ